MGLIQLVYYFLRIYEIILLIRIVMSWIRPDPHHPVVRFIYTMTEPVLEPVRRMLPLNSFGFDFSPIIVLIILELLQNVFLRGLYYGF